METQIVKNIMEYDTKYADGTLTDEYKEAFMNKQSKLSDEIWSYYMDYTKENIDNLLGEYLFFHYYMRLNPENQAKLRSFATQKILDNLR
jgi:hypothetical protein